MWRGYHLDIEVAMWVVMTYMLKLQFSMDMTGVPWLSGRLLDSRQGPQVWTSPASLRCVLEQDTLILA